RRPRYLWGWGHERQEYWPAARAPAAQRRGTQSWLLRLPASGGDARRGAGSRPSQSLLHVREELLEQPEQLERRAVPTVAHERQGEFFLPVDFPTTDGRPAQAGVALRTLCTALSLLAGSAALALAGD